MSEIRSAEVEFVLRQYGPLIKGKRLLEIGAGTGQQLALLQPHCQSVTGVEVADATLPVTGNVTVATYDGVRLPFEDRSFDVIYSSNVLEHVRDLPGLLDECRRVLAPGGCGVHLVPSTGWRFWTTCTHYPALPAALFARFGARRGSASGQPTFMPPRRSLAYLVAGALFPSRHGERGNRFTEIVHFRRARWRKEFAAAGWTLSDLQPSGLWYSGNSLLGSRIPLSRRRRLSTWLGSACFAFVARPPAAGAASKLIASQ